MTLHCNILGMRNYVPSDELELKDFEELGLHRALGPCIDGNPFTHAQPAAEKCAVITEENMHICNENLFLNRNTTSFPYPLFLFFNSSHLTHILHFTHILQNHCQPLTKCAHYSSRFYFCHHSLFFSWFSFLLFF